MSRKFDARDATSLGDEKIVINYEVNVNAFYGDLMKRMDHVEADLRYVKGRCENRIASRR